MRYWEIEHHKNMTNEGEVKRYCSPCPTNQGCCFGAAGFKSCSIVEGVSEKWVQKRDSARQQKQGGETLTVVEDYARS